MSKILTHQEINHGNRRKFGFMLVPNGQVQQVFDNPEIGGAVRPLFSLATANPNDAFHVGQIADVTGDGNTFVMEDLRVDGWTDRDYNDLIFQVKGATGEAVDLDDVIADGKDWRETELGQELINYTEQSIFEVEEDFSDILPKVLENALTDESPTISTVENGFGIMAGTSVATAKVTGAVSLLNE